MKRAKRNLFQRLAVCAALCSMALTLRAAEDFGDISVDPNAIYTGKTFHGYAEMRVLIQNRSHSKSHVVTLVYPNNAYGNYGNTINRLSRTVLLAPDASQLVALFQPPLPTQGDNSIRIEVDHRREGAVPAPNGNDHCNYYSGGEQPATVFVSRNLDFDGVERLFQANHNAFTAAQAVGAPDAARGGYQPTAAWMPDMRFSGRATWLELDYNTPQTVDKVVVYNTQPPASFGFVECIGVSGTNVAKIPMSSGNNRSSGSGWITEFSITSITEPVKTVRLDFGASAPGNISIDAVQISGSTGNQWASDARASSDNSSATSWRGGGNANSVQCLRAESPVSEWSETWLAYSPFDAVVVNAADLRSMSPAVLGALGAYLQAGGIVMFSGKTDLPAGWHPSQKSNLQDGLAYDVGFGRCFAFNPEIFTAINQNSVQTLRNAVREAARYWQGLPGDNEANNAQLPVVETFQIPVRGIIFIMLAFIIVIGPVNIIYLNRRNRRTWMLWTIPCISIATTLVVFAYSLFREGITPDTRIAGLTVLDQTSHHAATIGGTAFYCPLTPSGGLHFDFATEVTPLVHIGFDRSGTAREVDWSTSQHFQRGWISARVPTYYHLRKSETRRERIQIVSENGKFQIVNGLGAPIKSLWIADADMNCYSASNVAAGQKSELIRLPQPPSPENSGAAGLLRKIGFAAHVDALKEASGHSLQPNTYIAVLDGNPFMENALGSAASPKRTKSSAVVFGILESPELK